MQALEHFVCSHPYFSMLVFIGIGILLKSFRRMNLTAIRLNLEDLELALKDNDLEKADFYLQRLKSGFGYSK
ncbi:hypothetical protein BN59_03158 [Legionella massiliensis]|uniref:Uncharacterized protein n=1 Tax=Legionella massiliensis TaxID=1034943 RepID=A0A078L3Y4_9GAMM|nr:hypothetical protein [Legionella massiliensis]CDZ78844.1 hypothetical protein BN59_03158 [Legionella massiliensis]CEE14582.1 hypothetical protein BN1094_03158 [Legionella massiliensis]